MTETTKKLFPHTILLGSQSPRRSHLMKESGFDIEVKTIDVDESYPEEIQDFEIAEYIALKKAEAYSEILGDYRLGLVADTIVSLEGEILEKPVDREDAIRMLRSMSGRKHQVYTGVCIFDAKKKHHFTCMSDVYFLELSDQEVEYYIDNFKPFDKAGSYGIQEWIGYTKIEKIEGSYSNIMGLPMETVYKSLFDFIANN